MRQSVRMIGGPWAALSLAAALAAAAAPASADGPQTAALRPPAGEPSRLTLRSPGLVAGHAIALVHVYDQSGCHGGDTSPALIWSHAPAGTRSFAVLMYDPDARGGIWWHWAAFDIPAGVSSLQAGAGDPARHLLPPGTLQVRNDFGSLGYAGPCPPPGPAHHYHLVLYALRLARLGLDASATAAQVAATARAHSLAAAEIVGLYGR